MFSFIHTLAQKGKLVDDLVGAIGKKKVFSTEIYSNLKMVFQLFSQKLLQLRNCDWQSGTFLNGLTYSGELTSKLHS